jgi:hypothetical protein
VPLSTLVEEEVITSALVFVDITSVTLATGVDLFLVFCLRVAIVWGSWWCNFANVVDPSLFRYVFRWW